MEEVRLERLAIEVPDLDGWIRRLEQTLTRAREAGWREIDSFHADGRRHVVFDVAGLRLVILEAG